MYEAISNPECQPGGHYHQALISPWHVAIGAHGKADDNHVIVLGKASLPERLLRRWWEQAPGYQQAFILGESKAGFS